MVQQQRPRRNFKSRSRHALRQVSIVVGVLVLAAPAGHAQLWVLSHANGRVLEFDDGHGSFVSTFVDPVTSGFSFPGGIAVRPTDGRLYVASTLSGEIWVYETATGLVLPPQAATGLLAPTDMVFDASGASLYFIADVQNGPDTDAGLYRLALPGGSRTAMASHSVASFAAIALQGSQLYVSDSFGGTILRYSTSGGAPTTVVSGLSSPAGLLFTSQSTLLVAESGSDRVLEYHESGGSWTFARVVMAAGSSVDGPFGLARAPDGRVSVSGSFSNDVVSVDLTTLAVSPLIGAVDGLNVPGALKWSGNTLLVASRSGNTVRAFDENGVATGVVARGRTAPADAALAPASGNELIVASSSANKIDVYDGSSGELVRSLSNACTTSFTRPFDVAADSLGNIYVSCPPIDGVRRFDTSGASTSFVAAGSGDLGSPRGLAFGPNGNLFVASSTGDVLEYSGTNGSFVRVFIDTTGNGGGPVDPYGLCFHQDGLFVTSYFPNEVREFAAGSGAFRQTLVASGAGGLAGPRSLAFGADGALYVTSEQNDSVKRYDRDRGSYLGDFVAPGSGGLDQPFDLAFGADSGPAVPALGQVAHAILIAAIVVLTARLVISRRAPRGPQRETQRGQT